MKKILVSFTLAGALATSMQAANENSGFIVGGSLGIGSNNNTTQNSTLYYLGAKAGYQAFITDKSGVRFYLGLSFGHGFYTSAQANRDLEHMFYVLGDVNVDYLYNWANNSKYTAGLYAGLFTGILTGVNTTTNAVQKTTVSNTTGINLGVRTSISQKHQVELGIKAALNIMPVGNTNTALNIGRFLTAQVSYLYRF